MCMDNLKYIDGSLSAPEGLRVGSHMSRLKKSDKSHVDSFEML